MKQLQEDLEAIDRERKETEGDSSAVDIIELAMSPCTVVGHFQQYFNNIIV